MFASFSFLRRSFETLKFKIVRIRANAQDLQRFSQNTYHLCQVVYGNPSSPSNNLVPSSEQTTIYDNNKKSVDASEFRLAEFFLFPRILKLISNHLKTFRLPTI